MADHLPDTNVGNTDYIRRQDAIDAFNRIKNTLKNPETAHYDTLMFYEIEGVLEDVEPADVVQVVRCKDCKHLDVKTAGWGICKDANGCGRLCGPNDFCSSGVRKE